MAKKTKQAKRRAAARRPSRAPSQRGRLRILIVEARFYEDLADALMNGARAVLDAANAEYDTVSVPGSLEIPPAIAMALDAADARRRPYDGVIALGCVIRGDTYHFEVVCNESGRGLMELAVRERPDLAILDVKMPKLTGLQATREIKRQAPEVAVLILSMHDDERYLFEALKAGASGYVLKAQADTDLLAAIRAVERGEPFLTPEAQRALIKDVLERGEPAEEELTPREEEIVKLVAEAHTTKQIAEILHLSEKTVENHRANAMRKLGMRDRVELVRYAIRRGLIDP